MNIQNPTSQQGKNPRVHAAFLKLRLIIKMSLINDKGLEFTNGFLHIFLRDYIN
jgi:hypothetical protein